MELSTRVTSEEEMQAFYNELHENNMGAFWEPKPGRNRPKPAAHVWRWKEIKPFALRAGEIVGTAQAERRVLHLLNPVPGASLSLSANIQIVLPGEVAKAHRHTMAALRLVVEASGGYTVTNGEAIPMAPGDLILTPSFTWHDHANDSSEPMIWIDGLDGSIVGALDATMFEDYPGPGETQFFGEEVDTSFNKYGQGSFKPAWQGSGTIAAYSPQMHYPWAQAKTALERLIGSSDQGSPYDGLIVEYTNPLTGGPVMPTIGCFAQALRPGKHTEAHRHTNGTVYHVVEGQGYSIVNGERIEWEEKDVFFIPPWATHEHVNGSPNHPAYLFSYTNKPVLDVLGLYREEPAGNHLG